MKPTPDQHVIDQLVARMTEPSDQTAQTNGHGLSRASLNFKPSPPRNDEEIIQACRAAKNAAKFADLYDYGDVNSYHEGDDSSADAGLLEILAFHTQDEAQLVRLFSDSALGQRRKWYGRSDYRQRTIEYVLGKLTDTWQPSSNDSARLIVGGSSKEAEVRRPPLPDHEVEKIAASVGRYDAPDGDSIYSHHTQTEFGGNKSEGEKPLPIKTVDEVISEAGEEVPWIVENLLARGALTDVSGVAKDSGKTTFWCHAIAAGARGEQHAGFGTVSAKYLYLTEQGNNFALALRDSELTEHADHIRIVQFKDVTAVEWNRLMHKAAADAKRLGMDVLLVDTFSVFARLKGSEENDAGPVADRMRVLRQVAQKYNIGVVLIRHAGKDGTPRGSSAFEAEADICVTIGKPEGRHAPTVRRIAGKGRYGVWERNVQLHEGRYVSLGSDDKIEFNRAVRFIKATLPESEESAIRKPALLENRAGVDAQISASTLDRALKWLVGKDAVGEEQLANERGKPKVYWLKEEGIYSHQTPSANGENKSELSEGASEERIRKLVQQGMSEKLAREEVLGKGHVEP